MKVSFRSIVGRLAVWGLVLLLGQASGVPAQDRQDARVPSLPEGLPQRGRSEETRAVRNDSSAASDYLIGPEDVLEIDVFGLPELTKTARVANDGTVSVALLGQVRAAGLTTTQLSRQLEDNWGKNYLESPQVGVFVKEYHAQPVSVVGAVEKPGLYQLTGPRTLVEVLSMAGGLAKRTSAPAGRTLYITRRGGFGDLQPVDGMRILSPDKIEINIRKLLYSNEGGLNIQLKPLDIVSVSKADIVYIMGRGVQKPGGFVLEDRESVTVFQALALAEGLSANAAKRFARIIRTRADGSKTDIPVNLDKVLRGKAPDPVLAANDILFVPDSAQKAGLKRGLEAAISTASGVLIFHQ